MRFPWLQVDADFIAAHAGELGVLLGISRREAIGLAVDLWTWALARARADAPPDGIVTGTGPVPDRLLAGSVGWTGPAEQFSEALIACGMAVRIDGGYRLTGFDRYKSTWEKNRRRAGGKPEGNRTGTGEEPARKTQTQTQTQTQRKKKEDPPNPPSGGEDPGAPVRLGAVRPASGEPWTFQDAIEAVHREVKGQPYGWDAARDDAAARKLLALCAAQQVPHGQVSEEIARRFGRALVRSLWKFEPGEGKAASLTALARPECWRRNSEAPRRTDGVRNELSGAIAHVEVVIDPWAAVLSKRGALE